MALVVAACRAVAPREPEPEAVRPPEIEDAIVIAGERFATGVPVVLWTDPGGFDAHAPNAAGSGFRAGRGELGLDALSAAIDQLVVHYDACGTSRACFEVLRRRGLAVQFLIDVDGTIWQTLDAGEEAWHATRANVRSIGVELASIGAVRPGSDVLDAWYPRDTSGPWIRLPEELAGGLRTSGFVGRPARPERVAGTVNGERLVQHDFTREQYRSLGALAATLCRALPRIVPDAPRDAAGAVRDGVLDDAEFERFAGILGHCHVQANKPDPGPAFDWERLLADVRQRLAAP